MVQALATSLNRICHFTFGEVKISFISTTDSHLSLEFYIKSDKKGLKKSVLLLFVTIDHIVWSI